MVRGWCKQYCDEQWCDENLDWNVSSVNDLFKMLKTSSYHCYFNPGLLKHLANKSENLYLINTVKNYEKKLSHVELKDVHFLKKVVLVENNIPMKNSDLIANTLLENHVTIGELWNLCTPRLVDDDGSIYPLLTIFGNLNLILDASTSLLNFYYSIKVCLCYVKCYCVRSLLSCI